MDKSKTKAHLNLVGPRVHQLRSAQGLTQAALVAKCNLIGWDVSRSTLSKVEYGIRRVNDAEVILLATALGGKLDDLYFQASPEEAVSCARHSK